MEKGWNVSLKRRERRKKRARRRSGRMPSNWTRAFNNRGVPRREVASGTEMGIDKGLVGWKISGERGNGRPWQSLVLVFLRGINRDSTTIYKNWRVRLSLACSSWKWQGEGGRRKRHGGTISHASTFSPTPFDFYIVRVSINNTMTDEMHLCSWNKSMGDF